MKKPVRRPTTYYAVVTDFGWMLLVGCGLFFLIGRWLDLRYGTWPWLAIGGVLLGIATGLQSLFRNILRLEAERKREESRQEPPDSDQT